MYSDICTVENLFAVFVQEKTCLLYLYRRKPVCCICTGENLFAVQVSASKQNITVTLSLFSLINLLTAAV